MMGKRNPSLFREISGLYAVFFTLFAIFFTVFTLFNRRVFLEETKRAAGNTVDAVARNVDAILENIERQSFSAPLLMGQFGEILGREDLSDQIKLISITKALEQEASLGNNLLWSAVIDDGGKVFRYGREAPDDGAISRVIAAHEEELHNPSGAVLCTHGPSGEFLCMRSIFDGSSFRFVGTFVAAMDTRKLDGFFEELGRKTDNVSTIKDAEGVTLYGRTGQMESKDSFSVEAPLSYGHLTLLQTVNPKTQNFALRWSFNVLLLFTCLFVSLMLLILLFVFRRLHKEISVILSQAEQISGGDFSPKASPVRFHKELSILSEGLAESGKRIQKLMEENASKEMARQQTEYQYLMARYGMLQAQINPHFLYNVLESINAQAQLAGDYATSDMICKLAEFYRMMFGYSGKEWLLSQEVSLIEDYLGLYQSIYPDRFTITIRVDDAAAGQTIPSLILQPLVENSIVHGFARKIGVCRLELACLKRQGVLSLTLADNGTGMSQERIEEVLQPSFQPQKNRMGIANVKERLHLAYGNRATLEIQSSPRTGTKVIITIEDQNG